MEAWEVLCSKAFNGDEAANHLILFLEGCGKLTATGFTVTTSSLNNPDCALLEQLGFVAAQPQNNNNEYTLPGQQWSSFLEKKRNARVAWHEQRQRELRLELNDALKQIQVLDGVNDQQRLALVKEFARRFANDVGVIPFMRGLVGFLRYQLFKHELADWECYEYVLTQNGTEVMVEYIRLLQGVLGFQLVSNNINKQQQQEDSVAIAIQDTQREEQSSDDDSDPVLVWRMNEQLTDHALSDILDALPREQGIHGYRLSGIGRQVKLSPLMGLQHPHLFVQWIRQLLQHCFSFIPLKR